MCILCTKLSFKLQRLFSLFEYTLKCLAVVILDKTLAHKILLDE